MLETFEEILTESLDRRAERNKRATTEDFDEEEMEALEDEQAAEDEVFDQFAMHRHFVEEFQIEYFSRH